WNAAAINTNSQDKSGLQPPPHPVTEPYDNCLVCHGPGAMKPFPDHHANTSIERCLICHR
ncbi:MAG: hypothetical protein P8Z37_11945, partial [Acidobacteriota bacterium]